MKAFAILLDTRAGCPFGAGGPSSLLLAPLGPVTVLRYLSDRLSSLGHPSLTVATDFEPDAAYRRRLESCGVAIGAVVPVRSLAAQIAEYEPTDYLVIVDPRCVPAQGLAPRALRRDSEAGARRVRHLVALEAHPGGTTERVQLDAEGAVGRIQRYYDAASWPFTSGVACSMLPVSCTVGAHDLPFGSLRDLRRRLSERGVPGHDVFVRGGAFDLSRERDLLRLSERLVLDHFAGRGVRRARRSVSAARLAPDSLRDQALDDDQRGAKRAAFWNDDWLEVGAGCRIDPSARLVGPVILHEGAVIGPEVIVAGPAVVGPGARIERGAVVAQCVVGPEAVVPEGVTLRHRAVFGTVSNAIPAAPPALYEPLHEPAAEREAEPARRRPRDSYALCKIAFDVTAAAAGLLVLSPLFALIALLVKLGSKGPVFYRDRREGRDGRVFHCLKFRTMFVGAEAQQRELMSRNQLDGPQFKLDRDPRVTPVGRLLRRFSLDELPQLINVVRLEMSLVGPRPSPFRENQLCVPWRDARLSVRPGITGLWQVCRHRRLDGDFHQWIQFDLLYVRHMSFAVDLKILAATVLTLAGQWPAPPSWILSAHG